MATQGLELTSLTFIILCAASVVAMRLLTAAPKRTVASVAISLCFLALLGFTTTQLIAVIAFVHVVYVITRYARHARGTTARSLVWLSIIALWALMFFGKDPIFAGPNNPFVAYGLKIVGLSYLCFRAISTVMDAPDLETFDYGIFIDYMIYFPTIIAGPIERYDRFEADRLMPKPLDLDIGLVTLRRIAVGFVKKFVLADNLAPFGIFAFGAEAASFPIWVVWAAVLLQLALVYLDFSGYCDIMIGVARLQGHAVQENFDRPYLAGDLQTFWNKWHMSLTLFVRDYVFTPISKQVAWHAPRAWQQTLLMPAYMLTMMIIALWHQITWGFFLFGLMHGGGLVLLQLKRRHLDPRLPDGTVAALLSRPPQLIAVVITVVFFAISTMLWYFTPAVSVQILSRMLGLI